MNILNVTAVQRTQLKILFLIKKSYLAKTTLLTKELFSDAYMTLE